jgi:hypothetical protein
VARPALAPHPRRGDGRRAARYPRLIDDALERFFGAPGALGRVVVLFCVGVLLAALVWLYPHAFADANSAARANARLDWVDRELGGGNSVLPAQAIATEARGRIPADGTFAVAVGPPRPGWSELAIPDTLENYMRYFLLPRKTSDDAPWILCFACDRSAYPGAPAVWEDAEQGLSILKRPS